MIGNSSTSRPQKVEKNFKEDSWLKQKRNQID